MSVYAKQCKLMGDAGAGQLTKMVNQICIAGLVQALSEGLDFARAAGLDPLAVVEVIPRARRSPGRWKTATRPCSWDSFDMVSP